MYSPNDGLALCIWATNRTFLNGSFSLVFVLWLVKVKSQQVWRYHISPHVRSQRCVFAHSLRLVSFQSINRQPHSECPCPAICRVYRCLYASDRIAVCFRRGERSHAADRDRKSGADYMYMCGFVSKRPMTGGARHDEHHNLVINRANRVPIWMQNNHYIHICEDLDLGI